MTAQTKAASRPAPKLTPRELAALQGAVDRCRLRQHLEPLHEAVQAVNRQLGAILAQVEPKPKRKRPKKGAKPVPDRGAALTMD